MTQLCMERTSTPFDLITLFYHIKGARAQGIKFFTARSRGTLDCQRLLEDQLWNPHAHFLVDSRCKSMGTVINTHRYRKTAACMLCQKAHEECGSSWSGELPRRQSATFRARGVLDKRRWSLPRTMRASGSCYKKSMCMGRRIHMRLLTIETESRLDTLWDQEECNQLLEGRVVGSSER
jgi:hypothetical protein